MFVLLYILCRLTLHTYYDENIQLVLYQPRRRKKERNGKSDGERKREMVNPTGPSDEYQYLESSSK